MSKAGQLIVWQIDDRSSPAGAIDCSPGFEPGVGSEDRDLSPSGATDTSCLPPLGDSETMDWHASPG